MLRCTNSKIVKNATACNRTRRDASAFQLNFEALQFVLFKARQIAERVSFRRFLFSLRLNFYFPFALGSATARQKCFSIIYCESRTGRNSPRVAVDTSSARFVEVEFAVLPQLIAFPYPISQFSRMIKFDQVCLNTSHALKYLWASITRGNHTEISHIMHG